jgi:Zn-dependent M28 family amino/carboxypeptidase
MKSLFSTAAAGLALCAAGAGHAAPDPQFTAAGFRSHVAFLADDLLEGRETGSIGHRIATNYVIAQFEAAGLKPAGSNGGWLQPVPLREARLVPGSGAAWIGDRKFANGQQVVVSPSMLDETQDASADVVFAGHCLVEPSLKIDDFKGLDVKGKIVACLPGFPKGLPSETAAFLVDQRARFATARGAIGMIGLWTRQQEKQYPFAQLVNTIGNPRMERLNPDGSVYQFAPGLRLAGVFGPEAAALLFAGAAKSFAAVDQAGETASVRGFPLQPKVRISRQTSWKTIESANVVGMVPGTDPALKAEHVVLGAHLDHIGIGKPVAGDAIYNGALDNAAGSATLIEVAKATAKAPPRRSTLFIAATAEEKGLLGAEYYAGNPTVPIGSIVGMIDLDMPILTYDFQDVTAYGADHSTVAQAVALAAGQLGLKLSPDPMPEETIFVRSDHYAFVQRGVPAIMLATGFAAGGDQATQAFFAKHYHQPSDDLSLPVHWDQGAKFADLNFRVMQLLANAEGRPRWYQGDFFGDRFSPASARAAKP